MATKKFYDYLVYSDGRIYSNLTNKFLKPDCYRAYAQVTLRIDGNHFNNNAENLEWVTCTENNRRAREKGLNNVSAGNYKRWNSEEFRNRVARNISAVQLAMMSELTALTGKSLSWVYNRIVKFLKGEDVPEFKSCGIISVVDLKGKVNRLSKAERQVE